MLTENLKWSDLKSISLETLPICNIRAEVHDISGAFLYRLKPLGALGKGMFAHVDKFEQILASGERRMVALKRPREQRCNMLLEALFQWKLYKELKPYGIQSCVPQVYSIFRYLEFKDAWFLMEAFEPQLLSQWCVKHITTETSRLFPLLLLQIALILEVFEEALQIDHRDLKVNNLLVLNEPVMMDITWKGDARKLQFPFRIVFLDFGFACKENMYNLKDDDGVPGISGCPNPGRDFFQILVSLWRLQSLRMCLEETWGSWIRTCIQCVKPLVNFESIVHNTRDIHTIYLVTEDPVFSAPLCTPAKVIAQCMAFLDGKK
jgi:serine/threonine protein kinase